jgi:hypothetical protein
MKHSTSYFEKVVVIPVPPRGKVSFLQRRLRNALCIGINLTLLCLDYFVRQSSMPFGAEGHSSSGFFFLLKLGHS